MKTVSLDLVDRVIFSCEFQLLLVPPQRFLFEVSYPSALKGTRQSTSPSVVLHPAMEDSKRRNRRVLCPCCNDFVSPQCKRDHLRALSFARQVQEDSVAEGAGSSTSPESALPAKPDSHSDLGLLKVRVLDYDE